LGQCCELKDIYFRHPASPPTSQPNININGKNITTGDNGVADYTFKASADTGVHIIPIKVEFVNLKGIKESKTDTVEYSVSNPK
jgi:hypothetical protein